MKKLIKKEVDLPFEVGKTYKTIWGEKFTITKIDYFKIKGCEPSQRPTTFWGTYENREHLGVCPINRLVAERTTIDVEIDICECCGKPFKIKKI